MAAVTLFLASASLTVRSFVAPAPVTFRVGAQDPRMAVASSVATDLATLEAWTREYYTQGVQILSPLHTRLASSASSH